MPDCFSSLSRKGGSPVAGELVCVFPAAAPQLCGWEQWSEAGRGHAYLRSTVSGRLPIDDPAWSSSMTSSPRELKFGVYTLLGCVISKVDNFMAQLNASPLECELHERGTMSTRHRISRGWNGIEHGAGSQ